MTTKLSKSLADLIDETLAEIEELKKSDRFSAEEIELGDKSAQGGLSKEEAEKAEDEDEEDEDEDEDEEEAKKAEDEDKDDKDDEEDEAKKAEAEMAKAEEECEKAEAAWHKALKKREMCKAELKHKKKPEMAEKSEGVNLMVKEEKEMKKSLEKSIDARISPLETKLAQVLDVVKQIAEAPLPQRGHTYRQVQPLAKSATEAEPLNKSAVLNKLLDLKKTGTDVDAADVVRVEVGGTGDLHDIANKYGIK
jgi:hypothetical protein